MKGTPTELNLAVLMAAYPLNIPQSSRTPWFYATKVKPEVSGWYEVRNDNPTHPNSKRCLVGLRFRFYDATTGLWMSEDDAVSIFGKYACHQWRGALRNDWTPLQLAGLGRSHHGGLHWGQ